MTDKTVTVTEETVQLLEAVCNILTQVAELQYDDEAKAGIYSMAEIIAETFDIEMHYVEYTEDEAGNTVIVVAAAEHTEADEDAHSTPDPDSTVH